MSSYYIIISSLFPLVERRRRGSPTKVGNLFYISRHPCADEVAGYFFLWVGGGFALGLHYLCFAINNINICRNNRRDRKEQK